MAVADTSGHSCLPPAMAGVVDNLLFASLAPTTHCQYAKEMTRFQQFCEDVLHKPHFFPASRCMVAGYVAYMYTKGYAPTSIQSALSAISYYHKLLDKPDVVNSYFIQKLIMGAKRARPTADTRTPVTMTILRKLATAVPSSTDDNYTSCLLRALLSLSYFALLRVSEMVGKHRLLIADVQPRKTSLSVTFRTYKHSVPGRAVTIRIPPARQEDICPLLLVKDYITLRGTAPGPFFIMPGGVHLTSSGVNRLLKDTAAAAGLSSYNISSHCMRIGRVCDMALAGRSFRSIQLAGRWKSNAFTKYLRLDSICF